MVKARCSILLILSILLLAGCSTSTPPSELTPPSPSSDHPISLQAMLDGLQELTAIEAYSGWRNSASSGESQALDWLQDQLSGYRFLTDLGMSQERQVFPVFMGTEIHTSNLEVVVGGQVQEIPADGMRGPRDDVLTAAYFDTDGNLSDLVSNPQVVEAPVYLIETLEQLLTLDRGQLTGQIAVVNYALIDRSIMETAPAVERLLPLLEANPDGIALVTEFSNAIGESHAAFIGDLSAFNYAGRDFPPTVYFRIEDASQMGLSSWADFASIESMRIELDVDVVSPAQSGNLIAHIPGVSSDQAIILSAHIDSPNGPGAMDDGSGSIILLEVARALNVTTTQPPTDVYLAWFGSEEIGLYGSAYFAATHQELLDRSIGLLQIDCLISPLDGIEPELTLVSYPYPVVGGDESPWATWIREVGRESGQILTSASTPYIYSDNNVVQGFDVPNVDFIYEDEPAMDAAGGFHYAAHVHDPYDTVDLIRENVESVLEAMAQVVYDVVIHAEGTARPFHLAPDPDGRVVIIATHTEAVHLSPIAWIDFGMELSLHGYDVDMIPPGESFSLSSLGDADLVIVPPTLDYQLAVDSDGDTGIVWDAQEVQALQDYVQAGGTLMLVNSNNRIKFGNQPLDENEDRLAMNQIANPFGISFRQGVIPGGSITLEETHPLLQGVSQLVMAEHNGVPFTIGEGQVLAWAGGEPVIAVTQAGSGEVIVLADVGLLSTGWGGPINQPLWYALSGYLASR